MIQKTVCYICNEGFDYLYIEKIRKHIKNDHEEVTEYVSRDIEKEIEEDKEEDADDEYDYYEGFGDDGNRIIEEEQDEN